MHLVFMNDKTYYFEEILDLKKDFYGNMIFTEHVALLGNDIKLILPELFLATSILSLILYSVNLSTNSKYNYPLTNFSVSWLSLLALILTFLLERNNVIIIPNIINNILVYDDLASVVKSIVLLVAISYLLVSQTYINNSKLNAFEYYLLILSAIVGLLLLISAFDLILTYLAIEMQSLSFYVLAAFKRNSAFSTEAGLKYFILGAFSSSLILFGSSLIYGFTGTTNFGNLSSILIGVDNNLNLVEGIDALKVSMIFLGVGLLFKLGAAPFHMWLPDIYEGAPSSSSALFATLPKIAIFVVFARLFQFSFNNLIESWQQFIVFSAVFSLIIGSFVALKQRKIKRLFAYSGISHVGYLLIAFATGTIESHQALFFYLYIYMITSIVIWALIMCVELQCSKTSSNRNLSDLSFLANSNSTLSFTFVIILFSLGGVPPLAGFYAKMQVFLAAINSSMYALTLLGILLSIISTFYYIRTIKTIYFEKSLFWSFYKPICQSKSIILGLHLFSVGLLFLNPNLSNLLAYKTVTSLFL